MKLDAILIAGPTASGKSALALRLARRLGGVIVNTDSMQVYRDLRILTARPSREDEAAAPHALYGMVDAAETYSVSRWLADAAALLTSLRADGLVPIFVGGTGMYFQALTQGLSDIPEVPADIRAETRAWAVGKTAAELHAILSTRDPATAAKLRPTDPQRLLRALEVHTATGRSLTSLQGQRSAPLVASGRCVSLFLDRERPSLVASIASRFDAMMDDGALDEVRRLATRALDPTLPAMRAHGVPPLLRHLHSSRSLDAAILEAKADTVRYTKRQRTFVRHQLPNFAWTEPEEAEAFVIRNVAQLS